MYDTSSRELSDENLTKMNLEDTEIMKRLHMKFVKSIDPKYLVDIFYSKGIITDVQFIELKNENQPVSERASNLMLMLPRRLESIDLFQDILDKNGYEFLADEIKKIKRIYGVWTFSKWEHRNHLFHIDMNLRF